MEATEGALQPEAVAPPLGVPAGSNQALITLGVAQELAHP